MTTKGYLTEIRITAGKDTFIFQPKSALAVVAGKTVDVPDKLAAELWKAVALPAEKMVLALKSR